MQARQGLELTGVSSAVDGQKFNYRAEEREGTQLSHVAKLTTNTTEGRPGGGLA